MYNKSVRHVQSCCLLIKPIGFLTFSSPSTSLDLKVPITTVNTPEHYIFLVSIIFGKCEMRRLNRALRLVSNI